MDNILTLIDQFKAYGVGRRKIDDGLFTCDKQPPRMGIFDEDDEQLCHEIVKSTCHIPGCRFSTESLLDFENHYNASHRYSCSQCKRILPSPHLLDLHIQEMHDSFFAVMATKKPSYCCYIEECKEKFLNAADRLEHGVKVHQIPKDFRFDHKPKETKRKASKKTDNSMEVDQTVQFTFSNNKQKGFAKYAGKKFTNDKTTVSAIDVNMDDVIDDLKNSLPE